jgi:hypothetical protein
MKNQLILTDKIQCEKQLLKKITLSVKQKISRFSRTGTKSSFFSITGSVDLCCTGQVKYIADMVTRTMCTLAGVFEYTALAGRNGG